MGLDQYADGPNKEFYWRKHARLQVFMAREYEKQNANIFMSDPRHKTIPPYLQTSGVSSTFIALKASLDKIREDRDAKKDAEKLEQISKTSTAERKSA